MSGYTNDEIVSIYKQSADKVVEISILAELNNCDEDTILEILMDAGVYEGQYKKCIKCGKEFLGVNKRGNSNSCPECRTKIATYARTRTRLIKNLKKIQELSEENMELMSFLEKEKKYARQKPMQKMQV